MRDPIVEEIHRRRVRRAARFHHDIDAMFDDLRRSEELSKAQGAIFVTPKPRKRRVLRRGVVDLVRPRRRSWPVKSVKSKTNVPVA